MVSAGHAPSQDPHVGMIPSMGSRKGIGILPLCPTQVRPHLQSCPSPGAQHRKELELLERAQRRLQDEQRMEQLCWESWGCSAWREGSGVSSV